MTNITKGSITWFVALLLTRAGGAIAGSEAALAPVAGEPRVQPCQGVVPGDKTAPCSGDLADAKPVPPGGALPLDSAARGEGHHLL